MPKLIYSSQEHHNRDGSGSWFLPAVKCDDPASQRYQDYLGEMLVDDVWPQQCAGLLAQVSDVQSGKIEETDHAANGWITVINRSGVTITHQYVEDYQDEALGHFTLAEFRAALEGWCRFLAKMDDKSATVEVEL